MPARCHNTNHQEQQIHIKTYDLELQTSLHHAESLLFCLNILMMDTYMSTLSNCQYIWKLRDMMLQYFVTNI